jgi:hypothetical protein
LLEDDTNSFLNVDEKTPWWARYGLLVMRHASGTRMPIFLKGGDLLWVVTMEVGLGLKVGKCKMKMRDELTWL